MNTEMLDAICLTISKSIHRCDADTMRSWYSMSFFVRYFLSLVSGIHAISAAFDSMSDLTSGNLVQRSG